MRKCLLHLLIAITLLAFIYIVSSYFIEVLLTPWYVVPLTTMCSVTSLLSAIILGILYMSLRYELLNLVIDHLLLYSFVFSIVSRLSEHRCYYTGCEEISLLPFMTIHRFGSAVAVDIEWGHIALLVLVVKYCRRILRRALGQK